MKAVALINDLATQDIHLIAKGETLQVDAPKGTLTPELVEELRANKTEILALLRRANRSRTPELEAITGDSLYSNRQTSHLAIYRVVVDNKGMVVIDPSRKPLEAFTKSIYDRFGEERVQTILRVR